MQIDGLKQIGEGRLRRVYAINLEKVLKVAKIKEGIQHNKSEFEISFKTRSKLLPIVFKKYNNFNSICVERADVIDEIEFFKLTGVVFKEFSEYCNALQQVQIYSYKDPELKNGVTLSFNKLKHGVIVQKFEKKYMSKEFIIEIKKLIKNYGQSLRDFKRISSYGKNKDNKLKIIDYGIYKKPFSRY